MDKLELVQMVRTGSDTQIDNSIKELLNSIETEKELKNKLPDIIDDCVQYSLVSTFVLNHLIWVNACFGTDDAIS